MENSVLTGKPYNIGYALSGGFIKGFAHLGVIQALLEHDIKPDIISGVSAGALAGVFYADGNEPYRVLDYFSGHKFHKGNIAERVAASCCMPVLFTPVKIGNTHYVDGGLLMNLPVSTIRNECEKVVAVNVSPLMAEKYKMNIVSIAMRSYHFMFRANTFPERDNCDLLIEPYNLEGYSNTELEKAEEIFEQGYNTASEVLDQLIEEKGKIWK